MPRGRSNESEGGRDEEFRWWASPERKNFQPGFINDNDARRSPLSGAHSGPARQDAQPLDPAETILPGSNQAGTGKPSPSGAAAIRALFKAVKEMLVPADEDAPLPARRRRGEAGRGFAAACRAIFRRAERSESMTMGGNATFADVCAAAGVVLSETLDYLNSWQESFANDIWQEDDFSATYWDNFPQP